MATPATNEQDQFWMNRALALAEQGVGLASPNPTVGCVVVNDSTAVGSGFHEYDFKDHAEIIALKEAGSRARGSTVYVTLEPCSFQNRTGPCADALIAAGVARVVVATQDPNPRVSSSGLRKLYDAGLVVDLGIGEDAARTLNDAFAKYIVTGLPFVTQKIALSLDGKIAPANRPAGSTSYITSETARAKVQRMRHASDAVLTGIGTVLADNPLLTDRSERPRRRPLMRIVLDSQLRIPLDCRLVQTMEDDLIVFTSNDDDKLIAKLQQRGLRIEVVPDEGGQLSARAVLTRIGGLGLTSVLTEAGSRLNAALLNTQITDKVAVFTAPVILGGDAVPSFAAGVASETMHFTRTSFERFDNDVLFTGYLRDPWAALRGGTPSSPA
jgi:diaminohydroxyphosphoribosylaminopyrimidine deaminase/5-amino-6-(5-phosphoribosylamino)uracil reductase